MRRVCLFNFTPQENFHGYQIANFDPLAYFSKNRRWSLSELKTGGMNGWDKRRAILAGAAGVDRLYRERDQDYMRMAGDFIDRFRDFDLIVMSTYNFLHPELLARELKTPIKVLGFVDDPISTYVRGIPYLWAFDGAFFVSPSYIDDASFEVGFRRWCTKPVTWWPLVPSAFQKPVRADEAFFRERDVDVAYVGGHYGSKVNRLVKLKQHFGARMRVHGRWPLNGYMGFAGGLLRKPIFPHRVTPLSAAERTDLYWHSKIGFNMHFSDTPSECGNMRTYETPAHGMMLVCDKASGNAHAKIFEPGREAVYYDSINQAIELIEHYLHNEDERAQIARAGYDRFWRDYEWESNLLSFLDWASALRA